MEYLALITVITFGLVGSYLNSKGKDIIGGIMIIAMWLTVIIFQITKHF